MVPSREHDSKQSGESETEDEAEARTPAATGEPTDSSRENDDFYDMQHKKRGKVIIFNQMKCALDDNYLREGGKIDGINLGNAFENHGFEVFAFHNSLKDDVTYVLNKFNKYPSLADDDCIVICYISRGGENGAMHTFLPGEYITAKELLDPFTEDNCPLMAGKPKLAFIQAGKGETGDKRSNLAIEGRRFQHDGFAIPNHADFFIGYSSPDGYASFREAQNGSWFIECLCKQLNNEETKSMSIFQWMTKVIRMVAEQKIDSEDNSSNQETKQCFGFLSRLTKDLILKPKPIPE